MASLGEKVSRGSSEGDETVHCSVEKHEDAAYKEESTCKTSARKLRAPGIATHLLNRKLLRSLFYSIVSFLYFLERCAKP
jgi:hypothetical protein